MNRIFLLVAILIFSANTDDRTLFVDPLEIPINISANFGELRPDHFHSGIDIKTNGITGEKVVAADDGYIYRISVSPGGFGNALYLRHSNGFSTVYGHLDSFIPDIGKYVESEQYRLESFAVELYPSRDKFSFTKGDLIAFSGNSGSSMGPHLHFEVRRSSNENPVDPLRYIDIPDNIRPVIDRVVIYPLTNKSSVNGYNEKVKFRISGEKGKYSLSTPSPIKVAGDIGIGVTAWDFVNDSWNKCGIRSIEMKLDGTTKFRHSIDEFSFSESRYINSYIDYAEQVQNKTYIQKTFVQPNNRLSTYQITDNDGIINLEDIDLHTVELIVSDFAGNISRVSFLLVTDSLTDLPAPQAEASRVIPYNEAVTFNRHDIKLSFPANCFYDTLRFVYQKTPPAEGLLSDIHFIHNRFTPVHSSYNVSILPYDVPDRLKAFLCLASVDNGSVSYAGGSYKDGFVTGSLRSLGSFAVTIDTIPPILRPLNFTDRSTVKTNTLLKIFIDDEFSGIAAYQVMIDNRWSLFSWDPKNKLLSGKVDSTRIESGKLHTLSATVTDNLGNKISKDITFYW